MQRKNVVPKLLIALFLAGAGLAGFPALVGTSACMFAADNGSSDAQLTAAIQKQLRNKNYKDVTVRVSEGTATLSGQVDLYAYKAEAVKKARKTRGIQAVRDNIAVGGPTIPDDVLQQKLLSKIEVDRIGFGQVFDAIGVSVRDGVATLEGHALGPVAQQSAVSLTEYMPGVKGVVNNISVDPVSPMDNGIRVRTYRAIYGYPAMRRYAAVPSRPIRISVQNGHVTLYGVVDSEMDKQLAYTRAMQVPNVFSVTNNLVVGGNAKEQK